MKKFVAFLLCVAMLCSLAVPAFAASPTVITLTADKTSVAKGEKVTITVSVKGDNLYTSLRATVNYDTAVFKFSSGRSLLPSDRWFGSSMGNVFVYADQFRESMKNDKFPDLFYDYAYVGDAFTITLEALVDCPNVSTVSVTPEIKHNNDAVAFTVNTVNVNITGSHNWSAWSKADEANHTRTCSKCQTPETVAHTWDNGKTTTAATCAKDGVKTYTCSGCGATKTEIISKDTVAHTYGAWTKDSDTQHKRTCTVSGCTAAETEAHQWDNGTVTKPATCAAPGEKTFTCSVCKGTKAEPTDPSDGHTLGKYEKVSDTEHNRKCTVSGCNYIEKNSAHRWSEFTVTKVATCKEDGVKTAICLDGCGAEKTEKISKDTVPHTYGSWVKESDTEHKHTCTVCATASESAVHTWNNGAVTKPATCKEEGVKTKTCTGCGAEKTEPIEKLKEHAWGKWTEVDATSHKRTCTVCGDSVFETAEHGKATKWTSDGTQHWHECADCKAKLEAAKHTPGSPATETTAQRCTVCNRILKAAIGHTTHKWDTKYTTDAESHWYACSGCNEKKDAKAHDFANDCDTLCETCQYTRETTHKFGTEWTSDASGHWHACTSCGEKADAAEHAPGVEATETTAQTCTACGFELAPALGHTHVFGEVWEKDDANHWHVCACGEKAEEAAHEWNENGLCPTCLAEKSVEETATNGGFPWWIILVAVLGIGAVVAIVIVGKKKKK